jgi:hypothetical protein
LHQFDCDSINIVMIVSVARETLREEFAMADEAFALSPISARATLPSEEDYEAIREAFMETSRGRWFLGEYTKRNRNADTRLVLDAVTRIEDALAAQKQPLPPPPDTKLADALAAVRSALREARAAASSASKDLDLEQHLVPVRKGTRVIREISWRLREIGADGRICDLIDSQLNAIETACGQLASVDPKEALGTAFDLIENRIGEFEEVKATASPPPPTAAKAAPSSDTKAATSSPAIPAEAIDEAADVTAQAVDVAVEAADVTTESSVTTAEAEADAAYDEAVLDIVAREMATSDTADLDEVSDVEIAETPPVAPEPADSEAAAAPPAAEPRPAAIPSSRKPILKPKPEVALKPSPEPPKPSAEPPLEPSLEASLEPSFEASLGSAILATGIVKKQKASASASDPLAPIRRMSQAEKIAFFS